MKFGLTAVLLGSALPQLSAQELIGWNATWRYSINMGDQGTAWRDLGFDDSTWQSGPQPFGFPSTESVVPSAPPRPFPAGTTMATSGGTVFPSNPNTANNPTTYYRCHFNVSSPNPSSLMLQIQGLLDDAAIVYLNGEQVAIFGGLTAGAPFTQLVADRGDVNARPLDTITLGGGDLLSGENVLAVELHQSGATSSDIVMGMSLRTFFGPVITNPNLPADTNVLQGRSATLTVVADGAPLPTYQWYFNNGGGAQPIMDATNSTYTITNMTAAKAGTYFARLTGQSTIDSRSATVGFIGDFEAPVLTLAKWDDATSVSLQFDEVLDVSGSSGTLDPFSYAILPESGLNITVGTVVAANNNTQLILTNLSVGGEPITRDPTKNYQVSIGDSLVSDPFGNVISPDLTVSIASPATLLDFDAVWNYNEANIDLGTSWFTVPVNTTTTGWQSGRGLLGQETAGAAVPLLMTDLAARNEGGPPTTYFVTHFTLGVPLSQVVQAQLFYYLDDSAVLYLNGVEVHRQRIAAGQTFVSEGTGGAIGDATLEGPFTITNLVQGNNELAVEVHQIGATSSDIVWGARIVALLRSLPTGPVNITDQPDSITRNEGDTAEFSVAATGQPPITYQWQKGGVNIMNETNATLTINNLIPSDGGMYRVVVTNPQGPVNSTTAILTVVADTTRPTLVSAVGSSDLATVRLAFSEGLDQASAENIAHYNVRLRGGGAALGVSSAVLTNGTNVIITTTAPRAAATDYEIVVTDVTDDAFGKNPINPNPTTANVFSTIKLLAINDTQQWRYDQSNVFPGATWKNVGFNDSGWPQGPALLAAEDATLAFPIRTPLVLDVTNDTTLTRIVTYYFRSHFNFAGTPADTRLLLTTLNDDGAIVYLNGSEIFRIGMGTNANVMHSDFATRTVGDAAPEGPFDVGIRPELVAGDNVVAVEVHQVNATSSDITMGLEIDAQIESFVTAPSLHIARLANGMVQLTWNAPGYILVQSPTVKGTYTAVAGNPASGVTITPTTGGQMYYQLMKMAP